MTKNKQTKKTKKPNEKKITFDSAMTNYEDNKKWDA